MPAPAWFFRFMYDRESAAWQLRFADASLRGVLAILVLQHLPDPRPSPPRS